MRQFGFPESQVILPLLGNLRGADGHFDRPSVQQFALDSLADPVGQRPHQCCFAVALTDEHWTLPASEMVLNPTVDGAYEVMVQFTERNALIAISASGAQIG